MAEAILRVRVEGGRDVDRALGRTHGQIKNAYQAMSANARRLASEMASGTVGAFKLQQTAVDAACKAATRAQERTAMDARKGAAQIAAVAEIGARRRARAAVIESAESTRTQQRAAREFERMESRKTRRFEEEIRRRRRAERDSPRDGRDSGGSDRGRGGERSRRGGARGMSGGDVVGLIERGVSFFAGYGDDLREAQRARNELDHRATLLATNELRTPQARSEIMGAVQRESTRTGMDAGDVLSALERAQGSFSALGDSASRATYLTTVLPMLANAAVATGTKLEDMVDSVGEYQRQMHIGQSELPHAIASMIAQGRLGSITARDQAKHMGVLMGTGARFLSIGNADDSRRSSALVGALFQTAGQAGGGGDLSATRTRAFQDNFSSDRGRTRLRELLGYNAFDTSGQIARRQGETQTDAFSRVIEDAYRRSDGNATRFGVAVGGLNVRSRALTDQMFRDLSEHGGRLSSFRALVDGV